MEIDLRSKRLIIKRMGQDDAPALFAYRSDPAVTRFQEWEPAGLDEVVEFITANQASVFDEPNSWFQVGIYSADNTPRLIGDIGIHFLEEASQTVELGITIAPSYQRFGYGSEALSTLIDHLFGALQKHRIIASIDPTNAASIALVKKVGMCQEAHFRQSLLYKGEWVDDLIFAILRSEWKGQFPLRRENQPRHDA